MARNERLSARGHIDTRGHGGGCETLAAYENQAATRAHAACPLLVPIKHADMTNFLVGRYEWASVPGVRYMYVGGFSYQASPRHRRSTSAASSACRSTVFVCSSRLQLRREVVMGDMGAGGAEAG